MQEEQLTEKIIGGAMRVHTILGPGFLESVYHNALIHELRKTGLGVISKHPIPVSYDGVPVGEFVADLFVENRVLVEIKANQALNAANEAQVVNYLTATGLDIGLLLNFGGDSLQFKRKTRAFRPGEKTRGKSF